MARDKFAGLTDAERAAFEWSKRQKELEKARRRRRSSSTENASYINRRYYRDSDSSDSDHPREPFNPLKLAHVRRTRRSRSPSRRSKQRSTSDPSPPSSGRWEHDLYESDTERAADEAVYRQRKEGKEVTTFKIDTRRGSWRSRAGGVYLPPEDDPGLEKDLYTDYKPRKVPSPERQSRRGRGRSRSYERPDPVYTLD